MKAVVADWAVQRAERLVALIAILIATAIAIVPPLTYFMVKEYAIRAEIRAASSISAQHMSELISRSPTLWQFQTDRLNSILDYRSSPEASEIRRLVLNDGQMIAVSADAVEAPVVVESSPVLETGEPVARLEIVRSRREVIVQSFWILGASTLLGGFALLGAGWLPKQAIKNAVAETRNAEQKAERLKIEAENEATVSRYKSNLLSSLGHRLRTPLHGLLGSLEMIHPGLLPSMDQSMLALATNAGRSLHRIVDQIQIFSQIDNGTWQFHESSFDLVANLRSVMLPLLEAAENKGLRLHFSPVTGVPPLVIGDEDSIGIAVGQLLDNAVKYSFRGSVRMSIEPMNFNDSRGAWTHITVSDEGPGIAPEHLERLFTPWHLDAEVPGNRTGDLALGLQIARGLVEGMGGRIWATSEKSAGSIFHVMLLLPNSQLDKKAHD